MLVLGKILRLFIILKRMVNSQSSFVNFRTLYTKSNTSSGSYTSDQAHKYVFVVFSCYFQGSAYASSYFNSTASTSAVILRPDDGNNSTLVYRFDNVPSGTKFNFTRNGFENAVAIFSID